MNIWSANNTLAHTLTQHTAAVKALAWCPWQPSLLATGGGSADHHIRFWNSSNGACVSSVDAQSQVSGLLWNREHHELVSSHGYAQNQLTLWKYPSMTKVAEIGRPENNNGRVFNMAMSPDAQTVVAACGDETLRFFKCFASDNASKKSKPAATSSRLTAMIR